MLTLTGSPVGGGIVLGTACVLDFGVIDIPRHHVAAAEAEAEVARLKQACDQVNAELQTVAAQLPADAPPEAQGLLDVQMMLLQDPTLMDGAADKVRQELVNIEWALAEKAEELVEQFRAIEDPYLRERGRDVEQVAERVLKALTGTQTSVQRRAGGDALIFVAKDLQPADMLQLKNASGFVFEQGGINSHSAILARSLRVPAVTAVAGATHDIQDGDMLILDGEAGRIIVSPDDTVLSAYRLRQEQAEAQEQRLAQLVDVPCVTRDGCQVSMLANIEQPEEAEEARRFGAEGIGLFRSEFLFLNRLYLPGEDEQYQAYRQVMQTMHGLPVTIRTIDVGADKVLQSHACMSGGGSALGLRAIRYSLAEPEMFLVQLRALLRASAHGRLQILLPMLSHPFEVDEAVKLLNLAREQLRRDGVPMAEHVPVGGMIEVPAAAMSADAFARKLDFLSVGTNDLVQYTLAVDRTDHRVAHLHDELHPAVLRLVALTIRAARKAGRPISVCGEMAGEVQAAPLLLGMGLRTFSTHPSRLLRIKNAVLNADTRQLTPVVRRMLVQHDLGAIRSGLTSLGIDLSYGALVA
ncbi:MAG: phosphoenolpyruvate--protein phosphotransferase [Lautropia sp.]|nr:phosphoenolpyruvate--protein phosphotransferase [Lautropia sp.]